MATATPSSEAATAAGPSVTPSAAPASSSQGNTGGEPSTVLKATTRLVIVDVVATDKHGDHVTDLRQSDFTVLEEGKEQKVRAFTFQHPAAVVSATGAQAAKAKLPPNVYTNISAVKQASALNILLLDALNTTTQNQAYARAQALKYLDKMPENQPLAIFGLTSRLRMLQDFTSDPAVLRNVVKNYKGGVSVALDAPSGGDPPEIVPPGVFDELPEEVQANLQLFEQERTAAQLDMRVRMTLDALQEIAKMLSGYPGRKNLIWVSEAFPLRVFPDSSMGFGTFTNARNYSQEIVKAANALIDAQVAVYPVGAAGLETVGLSAGSRGTDTFGRRASSTGPGFAQSISNLSSNLAGVQGTMEELAERTGGKAFYNRNDLAEVVRTSIDDGTTYYMLGYYPEDKNWNGKFRKIEVKVSRPGVKLRHRLGYYAAEPTDYAKEDEKTREQDLARALSLDTPVSTTVSFVAAVLLPSQQSGNKVVVNYNIDSHALTFESASDGLQHATLECVAQAYSEKGKPIRFNGKTLSASLKPETFKTVMQQGFPCNHDLELPSGKYLLRLAVRDDRTGYIGTTNARVTVPELAATTGTPAVEKPEEKK